MDAPIILIESGFFEVEHGLPSATGGTGHGAWGMGHGGMTAWRHAMVNYP